MAKNINQPNRLPLLGTLLFFVTLFALPVIVWSQSNTTQIFSEAAGKGGDNAGGSSLSLVMVNDNNSDTLPNWGEQIKFTILTTQTYPIVSMTCSVNGNIVYSDSHPYYTPNVWDDPGIFKLSSQAWTEGAADCKANLKAQQNKRIVNLATLSFHVSP